MSTNLHSWLAKWPLSAETSYQLSRFAPVGSLPCFLRLLCAAHLLIVRPAIAWAQQGDSTSAEARLVRAVCKKEIVVLGELPSHGEARPYQEAGRPLPPSSRPETETDFFLKELDAQITFVRDAQGVVTGLVLHQGGQRYASIEGERTEPMN
jgi:hypothetical protein